MADPTVTTHQMDPGSAATDPELVRLLRGIAPQEPPPPDTNKAIDLAFGFGDGINPPLAGMQKSLLGDMPCRINGWEIYGDRAGSVVFGVTAALYTDASPVNIAGAFRPGTISARKNFGNLADVSTWDKDLIPDKTQAPPSWVVVVSIVSVSGFLEVTLALKALRLDL